MAPRPGLGKGLGALIPSELKEDGSGVDKVLGAENYRTITEHVYRDVAVRTVVIAALIALPWFLWGLIRWIPDLIDGRSYALNPPGRARVALNLDLFKRIVEWVLGNTGRMTPLVFALVVLAVGLVLSVIGHDRLLGLLSPTPVDVDDLIRESGMPKASMAASRVSGATPSSTMRSASFR